MKLKFSPPWPPGQPILAGFLPRYRLHRAVQGFGQRQHRPRPQQNGIIKLRANSYGILQGVFGFDCRSRNHLPYIVFHGFCKDSLTNPSLDLLVGDSNKGASRGSRNHLPYIVFYDSARVTGSLTNPRIPSYPLPLKTLPETSGNHRKPIAISDFSYLCKIKIPTSLGIV